MPEEIKKDPELIEILSKCLDAPGYVVFVGIITPQLDAEGRNVLNFKYKRSMFSFEDTSIAIKQFKKELMNEIGGE